MPYHPYNHRRTGSKIGSNRRNKLVDVKSSCVRSTMDHALRSEAENIYICLCLFLIESLSSHNFDLNSLEDDIANATEAPSKMLTFGNDQRSRSEKWQCAKEKYLLPCWSCGLRFSKCIEHHLTVVPLLWRFLNAPRYWRIVKWPFWIIPAE